MNFNALDIAAAILFALNPDNRAVMANLKDGAYDVQYYGPAGEDGWSPLMTCRLVQKPTRLHGTVWTVEGHRTLRSEGIK